MANKKEDKLHRIPILIPPDLKERLETAARARRDRKGGRASVSALVVEILQKKYPADLLNKSVA